MSKVKRDFDTDHSRMQALSREADRVLRRFAERHGLVLTQRPGAYSVSDGTLSIWHVFENADAFVPTAAESAPRHAEPMLPSFEPNQRVRAVWPDDGHRYPATVVKTLRSGKIRVRFDDEDGVFDLDPQTVFARARAAR